MTMTNKFQEARDAILRRLDRAGTYRPINEDDARSIVSSVLNAFIDDENRKEAVNAE